ncbi:MAG: GNAT family N-acetyltransferase [Planctomycetota bacterium]
MGVLQRLLGSRGPVKWPTRALVDRELVLVRPSASLIELMVESDPDTPDAVTRARMHDLLARAPGGVERGSWLKDTVPALHFLMRLQDDDPVPIAGAVGLRIGDTEDLRMYAGHVGYHVHRKARGRAYAERSVRLVLPVAKALGMRELFITANPENAASRRTIEKLGGDYLDIVDVPKGHPLHRAGEKRKARYRLEL